MAGNNFALPVLGYKFGELEVLRRNDDEFFLWIPYMPEKNLLECPKEIKRASKLVAISKDKQTLTFMGVNFDITGYNCIANNTITYIVDHPKDEKILLEFTITRSNMKLDLVMANLKRELR